MATQDEVTLRRVVVALDAAADFATTLELAAAVAAGLDASLHALFVEDESLLRVAGLPFVQQIDAVTAARSALTAADLDAELKALARQARREVERIAGMHALRWSLEVSRCLIGPGTVAVSEDELLVLATTSRPAAQALRLRSPWRQLVDRMAQPFLLVPERPATSGPIAVLYDAARPARRALDVSLRIAHRSRRPLIVAVPESLPISAWREAESLSHGAAAGATLQRLPAVSRRSMEALVAASGATLVVLGRDGTAAIEPAGIEPFSPFSALLVL